jgi:hypothetical protein
MQMQMQDASDQCLGPSQTNPRHARENAKANRNSPQDYSSRRTSSMSTIWHFKIRLSRWQLRQMYQAVHG